jgi:hypothetical protein
MPHIVDVIAELDHHQRIELADLYAANVITGIDVRVAKRRLNDATEQSSELYASIAQQLSNHRPVKRPLLARIFRRAA